MFPCNFSSSFAAVVALDLSPRLLTSPVDRFIDATVLPTEAGVDFAVPCTAFFTVHVSCLESEAGQSARSALSVPE